jgi:protein-S-isoprenylcysteine O-methyltransferase Ste14
MTNLLHAAYGLASYLFFLGTFLYAIAFVFNVPGLKTIDRGGAGAPLTEAIMVDLLLLAAFAIQHSVMARPAFKRWWTRIVPPALERSTYTLLASAVLALLVWQWRPIAGTVWSVDGTVGIALQVLSAAGWCVVLISTYLINHFELFGLRQSFAGVMGLNEARAEFRTPLFYRWVRHPIYVGFIVAFWATPVMSTGHLLFAAMTTGYILVGIWFEERDLVDQFGAQYLAYRRRVGALFPRLRAEAARGTAQARQFKRP